MEPKQCSAKELAGWLGISDRSVRDLAERGIISRTAKGRYPLRDAVAAYCGHIREVAAGRSGDDETDVNLTKERALLAREQREGHSLKNAERRRELLDAKEVERTWANVLRGVRAKMTAISSRCRQRLPHLTVHDVGVIDTEIRTALEEIGNE